MCGFICAFGDLSSKHDALKDGLTKLAKRGPDFEGIYHSGSAWLGHRRLAIIDLDSRSNQPFVSVCGRYVIVFNGEIYNFKDLSNFLRLRGICLRTLSDTETILELFILEGPKCLCRMYGMFALVIWDNLLETAFVARDGHGIKPLFYSVLENGILFSSQVKAIIATGLVSNEENTIGAVGFWMLGSVPDNCTIYKKISIVQAGQYMIFKGNKVIHKNIWFDVSSLIRECSQSKNEFFSKDEIFYAVKQAISESVVRHLESDVPIGIFLSGGVDSGVLAGLIRERTKKKIIGITIVFEEFYGKKHDETERSKIIAKAFGIEHHIRVVSKEEFISDLANIIEAMDQPSIDGINVWYASKAASELGLKVVMSGIGGDELFWGYNTFKLAPKVANLFRNIKSQFLLYVVNRVTQIISQMSNKTKWKFFSEWCTSISGAWWLLRSIKTPDFIERKYKNNEAFYENFRPDTWINDSVGKLSKDDMIAIAQIETTVYLRNQLLRDGDWASMHHSIELRTPFVDSKLLIDLLPFIGYFRSFPNKILLINSLEKICLPKLIYKTKKTGFAIPINKWIAEITLNKLSWQEYVYESYQTK